MAERIRQIKGIGPRYARALHQIGVESADDLQGISPEELHDQLADAGVRVSREQAAGWIAQAHADAPLATTARGAHATRLSPPPDRAGNGEQRDVTPYASAQPARASEPVGVSASRDVEPGAPADDAPDEGAGERADALPGEPAAATPEAATPEEPAAVVIEAVDARRSGTGALEVEVRHGYVGPDREWISGIETQVIGVDCNSNNIAFVHSAYELGPAGQGANDAVHELPMPAAGVYDLYAAVIPGSDRRLTITTRALRLHVHAGQKRPVRNGHDE